MIKNGLARIVLAGALLSEPKAKNNADHADGRIKTYWKIIVSTNIIFILMQIALLFVIQLVMRASKGDGIYGNLGKYFSWEINMILFYFILLSLLLVTVKSWKQAILVSYLGNVVYLIVVLLLLTSLYEEVSLFIIALTLPLLSSVIAQITRTIWGAFEKRTVISVQE